jgi:predicted DNA-binding protein
MKQATRSAVRNFHLPLPEAVYEALRDEAARSAKPATVVAREAIEAWLRERKRSAVHEAIAHYAVKHAGTSTDLDPALEKASLEILRQRKPRA